MRLALAAAAVSALVLLPLGASAQTPPPSATEAPTGAPPVTAPAEAPAEVKAPKITGVLGDFDGGDRSRLAARGFTVQGHLVTESAANLSGGLPLGGTAYQRGTAASTEFGFGFALDFAKLARGGSGGTLHALLTTRFGSNLSAQAIGNLASVEEIYGDGQTTRITFLDYEQPMAGDHLDLRLGKYNQQNDFIAGSTYWAGNLYCFYQNNDICGTPAGIPIDNGVVANGSEGYTYYPSSQWGARLRVNPSKALYLQAAVIQANPLVNNANGGLYVGFNGGTGVELPVEVGVTLNDRRGELLGDVRVGGYYDTSQVQDYAARAIGNITLAPLETTPAGLASNTAALAAIPRGSVRGRSGAYVQLDHLISGGSAAGEAGTALFAAFEYADPQTSLLSTMADIGLVRHGTFAGRVNDTIALGFAIEDYNVRLQRLETALQATGAAVPRTVQGQVIELNYGLQATPWLTLRPGLQYVIHPGGVVRDAGAGVRDPARNALVIGIGGYVTL